MCFFAVKQKKCLSTKVLPSFLFIIMLYPVHWELVLLPGECFGTADYV